MNDFMFNMALDHFGFDETQKATILAAIPRAAYLIGLVKNHKTVINELIDVANMVAQQVAKRET